MTAGTVRQPGRQEPGTSSSRYPGNEKRGQEKHGAGHVGAENS